MGGLTTVPADPERIAAAPPRKRKGDSILSRFMQDRHKRMSRLLGCTLVLGDADAWQGFGLVAAARLTAQERGYLAAVTLATLPLETVEEIAAQALGAVGDPLPPFLGGMEDARFWASLASRSELKAYALACFEAMAPKDQAAFYRHIGTVEVAA